MNKGELVEAIAEKTGMSKGEANKAVEATLSVITETLVKGEELKLTGFGTFYGAKREAGEGRNPSTGEKVQIAASTTPKFKAGATLKNAVNGK